MVNRAVYVTADNVDHLFADVCGFIHAEAVDQHHRGDRAMEAVTLATLRKAKALWSYFTKDATARFAKEPVNAE